MALVFDLDTRFSKHVQLGEGIKFFIGEVKHNDDPKKLQRLKIKIDVILPYDDHEQLPWSYPIFPTGHGSSSKTSYFAVPEVGTKVVGLFPYQQVYFPFYFGSIVDSQNRMVDFLSDYPNQYGTQDSIGNRTIINKRTKTTEIQYPDNSKVTHDYQNGTIQWSDNYGNNLFIDRKGHMAKLKFGEFEFTTTAGNVLITMLTGLITANVDMSIVATGLLKLVGSPVIKSG